MIVHRFCSAKEYELYIAGKPLENFVDHAEFNASTASGFCFFKEDPEEAKHWLSGIVDFDYCITLEAPRSLLVKCFGRYPNWISPCVRKGSVVKEEWCCHRYDKYTFPLISATTKFADYAPGPAVWKDLFPYLNLWK